MSEVDGVKAINKVTFGQRLKAYKRSKLSFLLAVLVLLDDSGSSDRSTAWYFLSYLYG